MKKILLTGSTGYIGRRLLPILVNSGYEVHCLVRDRARFDFEDFSEEFLKKIKVIEGDLLKPDSLVSIQENFSYAYFLAHSMTSTSRAFDSLEHQMALNFGELAKRVSCEQIVYLSGISNDDNLSKHLESRREVEKILSDSGVPTTVLRAAIIIGSGSASFEIIRDLVEKLPIMVAPKWLNTKCQPIPIRNVLEYLLGVLGKEEVYAETFDIGGPEVLTYKEMLLGYAKVRGLSRSILTLPVLTPRLSSLWLYFVTSTSFILARTLVNSMKNEVVCKDNRIKNFLDIPLLSYEEAIQIALSKIESDEVESSWIDSVTSSEISDALKIQRKVPEYGCFKDEGVVPVPNDPDRVLENIWRIGGKRGWYYGKWLWEIRGFGDKLVGGVGLRRGRRNKLEIKPGDTIDFWRVLEANKENKRLLLFAEMKLPGEAWLEFKLNHDGKKGVQLVQTATFRPKGLWGRLYWYMVLPFHAFIFQGMAERIVRY